METLDQHQVEHQQLISQKASSDMRSTSPWMMFVGIMFLITGALMGVSSIAIFAASDQYSSIGMGNTFIGVAVFYLIAGILFGVAGFFLISSGSKLSTLARYPNTTAFEAFVAKQKGFWILMGIFWIVGIIATIAIIAMAGRAASLLAS